MPADEKPRSDRQRQSNREWGRENSAKYRDIAEDYPRKGNARRRAACERDLRRFCEAYFPQAFNLAWSADHLRVIAAMQEAILKGGLFAMAMPRGSGKTTLCIKAATWALLYGHRRFVCVVGATERHATEILKQLKADLSYNATLARVHRQVCHPIWKLENEPRRCKGQTFKGEQTRSEWAEDHITLPTMPDSACDGFNVSGSTVSVAALTGALRGRSHALADGRVIRPELVLLDDPQTRESASSATQNETRSAIIHGDVLGMGGPDQKITAIMPCTVIRRGDLADRMLDRKVSPKWKGIKCRILVSFPADLELWAKYKEIRDEDLRNDGTGAAATELYRRNRAAMDLGGLAAWEARHNADEISAIQHAMNLKCDNEAAFYAEYMNDPLPEEESGVEDLTAEAIAGKVNHMGRGEVPVSCTKVTAFVDVHAAVLYYAVCAWEDNFTGYVIDYGTYPDQKEAYFTLADARRTLATAVQATSLEGQLYGGLQALAGQLLAREWAPGMKVDRCLVDAGWGESTDLIYKSCHESPYSRVLTPSHGRYIGASSVPMREKKRNPGDRVGLNWRVDKLDLKQRRQVRHVWFDANFWKSCTRSRLATAMGDPGCLSLFGGGPGEHRLYAEHLTSERGVATTAQGRTVDEWRFRGGSRENHFWDCTVGCLVAASMEGVAMAETRKVERRPNVRRKTFGEAFAENRSKQNAR